MLRFSSVHLFHEVCFMSSFVISTTYYEYRCRQVLLYVCFMYTCFTFDSKSSIINIVKLQNLRPSIRWTCCPCLGAYNHHIIVVAAKTLRANSQDSHVGFQASLFCYVCNWYEVQASAASNTWLREYHVFFCSEMKSRGHTSTHDGWSLRHYYGCSCYYIWRWQLLLTLMRPLGVLCVFAVAFVWGARWVCW